MQLFLKILSGMANSVDSDQTAPSGSGSALFAYIILSETLLLELLGHLQCLAYMEPIVVYLKSEFRSCVH